MSDSLESGASSRATLSVVVPVYNEAEVLPLLVTRLRAVLDAMVDNGDLTGGYEVVAVDDGSKDTTPVLLQRFRAQWSQLRVVRLRANAGHQAAISAGLTLSRGDFVATLDADLQDPPELLQEMLAAARRASADVVYAVRSDRSSDSPWKRGTARAFYRLIRGVSDTDAPADAGDYRMMSRATVEAVNALPEHHRVLRFVVPALGFPSTSVTYRREVRAAGESKYPLGKMIRLSIDSLTGFSLAPLRLATWFGLGGGLAAVGLLLYAVVAQLAGRTVAGWTSTVVAVAAVGAIQLLCVGMLGEYVGRMYVMMQGRPSYFVAYDSLDAPSAALSSPSSPEATTSRPVSQGGERSPAG